MSIKIGKNFPSNFESLYSQIRTILENARHRAYRSVNFEMVIAYWEIGRTIVEEEQKGKKRAEYGDYLIKELSKRLKQDFGKGFDESNLRNIRQFYLTFPIRDALRSELTWTHYRLLMRVEDENARNFYLEETINNNWSTRALERQINSFYYERLLSSRDKQIVKKEAEEKTKDLLYKPKDFIKDPYVLEFLGLPDKASISEKDLEQVLIDKIQHFLLELGKGFSFVERQNRISVENDHFYIDLVFYNYLLKCFVLIELKIGKLTHQDIGQMDFYVRYFEKEIKLPEDNPTIGILLCSDKNEAMVKYTLLAESKRIFASKYKLYLPSEKELKEELQKERELIERELRLKDGL